MKHFFYDRDLRRLRGWLIVAMTLNLGGALGNFIKGNLMIGVCCVVWAASVVVGVQLTRVVQQQRDQHRLLMAACKEEEEL